MSLYELKAKDKSGKEVALSEFKGKALIVVNTASKCGFTPQYKELQSLYEKYGDKGLEILAFPCDQFAHQEPGNDEEIASFCSLNYGVTFPVFSKIEVNGPNTHPVFHYLKDNAPGYFGKTIKWNFTKFIVSPEGKVVDRFSPVTPPSKMEEVIKKQLPKS